MGTHPSPGQTQKNKLNIMNIVNVKKVETKKKLKIMNIVHVKKRKTLRSSMATP